MHQNIAIFLFFTSILLVSEIASSSDKVRVPVKCSGLPSCGDDITLDEIRKSYENAKKIFNECKEIESKETTKNNSLSSIFIKLGKSSSCEAEVAHNYNVCGRVETTGYYHFWAPYEKYQNGDAALKEILSNVNTMNFVGSGVFIDSANSTPNERHIAFCKSRKIGGKLGVPTECVTVAVITDNKTYLRGRRANQIWCHVAGSLRSSGTIDILFEVKTKLALELFSNNIMQYLNEHMGLSSERETNADESGQAGSIYVMSSSGFRNSKVLKGWREILDFDIYSTKSNNGFRVRAVARTMVSQLNLGSITEYTGLNDVQKDVYLRYLDNSLQQAIVRTCSKSRIIDSKNIVCE
jgi:hypothetical protein